MAIQPVSPDDVEQFTIVTNPSRFFASSSISGLTGSVYVFARRGPAEKETRPLPAFIESTASDSNLDSTLTALQQLAISSTNIASGVNDYLSKVDSQLQSQRKLKYVQVIRFTPDVLFTKNTVRKLIVKDTVMPFYRDIAPTYHYGYTNYHSLNFFTASSVPSGSALLYPNVSSPSTQQLASGAYMPTGALSFDFYINPRYTTDNPTGGTFKAGTIFHLSSTYAVSLVSGSSHDINGYLDGFRLMLQLSHSADIQPSAIVGAGSKPRDLIFLSADNSLRRNHWHHVVIRWGTNTRDFGTGSFFVDGVNVGNFVIPSSSIAPAAFIGQGGADILTVGNYYEGDNGKSGVNTRQTFFFGTDPATRDGLPVLVSASPGADYPSVYKFNHPLNAEVHDLMIKAAFITNDQLVTGSGKGPDVDLKDVLFYLPPFFTPKSPTRKFVTSRGGILQTPFFAVNGTTTDPFNIAMSFGVDGHYMNLENFTQDFATGFFPRLLFLSGAESNQTGTLLSANQFLYSDPAVVKRNLTILPCDDGNFVPNFDIISSLFPTGSAKLVDDIGVSDFSLISLQNMVPSSTLVNALTEDSGSIFNAVAGPSPESIGVEPGEVLTVYQRTRDPSSNEVVFFDISNLFYGNRILPGSLVIQDTNVSGSTGKVSITLKDDGNGNLYRANCVTSQSLWSSVGNVFYNEGIVLIKTPEIPFFGQDWFNISFKGEQNVHTMRLNVLARGNELNSSSNPAFQTISASFDPHIEDQSFVYITGMNFHDSDLNVIMKTQLAQPITKRTGERYMFKVKLDW